jgi:hypothetical protein
MTAPETTAPAAEEQQPPSKKRAITASVTTVALTVVLGLAANAAIGYVAAQVHKKINPPPPADETSE